MRDYIKNSKQVDMFLGSIDPVIIEFQFSSHPKVTFKKALEIFTNLAEKFVYNLHFALETSYFPHYSHHIIFFKPANYMCQCMVGRAIPIP